MFDYKLIEALAMVSMEGGFDKAAKVMHITQSAVSQRLKQLEQATGQVLIARTTPPKATVAGQKLIKHYLQVKRLEEDLSRQINDSGTREFSSLTIGVNADSLALWFLEAVRPFLIKEKVLLDIRVNDQEQTHKLFKNGEVMGCISTLAQPMQGSKIEYLGRMHYHMTATRQFAACWFPKGLNAENVQQAPAVIFDRQDSLHHKLLLKALGLKSSDFLAHYVPSVEKFAEFIAQGIAYGALPDQQSRPLLKSGKIIDLLPDFNVPVDLYWHCWNLKSDLLDNLTKTLTGFAKLFFKI